MQKNEIPGERRLRFMIVNPDSHPVALDQMAEESQDKDILVLIALHQRALKCTLLKLATHPSSDVRCAVSENAATPIDIIWKLANDEDPDVRYAVAENHNIDAEILKAMASDDNPYVASRAQKTLLRIDEAKKHPFLGAPLSMCMAS